jgi:SH3-like domain-containing protein
MILRLLILMALAAGGIAAPAAAAQSGLPVPRFVTLGASEVNLRTGPGSRYPVEWVFVRRGVPVEITAEFDTWRRIRDIDGAEGWVHQSLLSGQRGMIVRGPAIRDLRGQPDPAAPVVARAEPGVIGRLLHCPAAGEADAGWCQVEIGAYRGWIERDGLWGVYPDEAVE